jgi:hypothetical protein
VTVGSHNVNFINNNYNNLDLQEKRHEDICSRIVGIISLSVPTTMLPDIEHVVGLSSPFVPRPECAIGQLPSAVLLWHETRALASAGEMGSQ